MLASQTRLPLKTLGAHTTCFVTSNSCSFASSGSIQALDPQQLVSCLRRCGHVLSRKQLRRRRCSETAARIKFLSHLPGNWIKNEFLIFNSVFLLYVTNILKRSNKF